MYSRSGAIQETGSVKRLRFARHYYGGRQCGWV